MIEQHINLLNELGFNTNLKGAKYFVGISFQMQELIDNNNGSLENITDNLPGSFSDIYQFIDSLYLEDYKFFYECGRKKYLEEMDEFINSRKITSEEQKKLNNKVFGNVDKREDLILNLCMFFSNEKKVEKNESKIFQKK